MILFDGGRRLIKCKHCKRAVHAIHRKQHLRECASYQRHAKVGRMALEKDGKRLYAIAIQRYSKGQWLPEMHYTHAFGPGEARRSFLFNEPNRATIHIVDVGLAIGMFMVDRDGKQLVAD